MDMQSAGYFVFLGTLVILHRQLAASWRPWMLLAASLLFYAQSSLLNLGIIAIACAINYAAVSFLSGASDGRARAGVFAAIVAIDLALLIAFKYCLGPLHYRL